MLHRLGSFRAEGRRPPLRTRDGLGAAVEREQPQTPHLQTLAARLRFSSMPSLLPLLVLASASPPQADTTKTMLDRDVAMRVRAFQEEQSYPLPSKKNIDEAEKAISKQPCIGDLAKWHRRYMRSIDWAHGHIDRHRISFDYREASIPGHPAGRKVGRLAEIAEVDDGQYRLASGVYDTRSRVVTMEACGWNWPSRPHKPDVR